MKPDTAAACVAALFLAASVFGHTVALRLLLLGGGIVLTSVVVARERELRTLPSLWIPFLLWAVWAGLSLVWSLEPERTLEEWRNEVFYAGAGLWICFVGAQTHKAARIFPLILASAGVLACFVALYHFFLTPDSYDVGWHGGPGDHTSALITLMPCVVMAGWYAGRARWPLWTSLAIWSLVALFLASAYTTSSRTVWPGFGIQFVLLGALALLRMRAPVGPRPRYAVASAAVLTVAAAIGCVAMAVSVQAERRPMGVVKGLEHETRLALWPKVIERIAERPLTGYGFGRGVLRESFTKATGAIDSNLWHTHNLILETMIQTGIPGLLLLAALLAAVLREAWRLARDREEAAAACGIALIGVVVGMFARNMTDVLLARQNSLLFWGVVGVLLGLAVRSSRAETA